MPDLPRLGVSKRRRPGGLGRCQESQHACGELRIKPQRLQGSDDCIASELCREPGDSRVWVGARGQWGRQESKVGIRFLHPLIEQPSRSLEISRGLQAFLCISGRRLACLLEAYLRRRRVRGGPGFDIQVLYGSSLELDEKLRRVRRERKRLAGKLDLGDAGDCIQPPIGELYTALAKGGREKLTAPGPHMSLNFKDVHEIRGERQPHGHVCAGIAEVAQSKAFVHASRPQQPATLDVNHSLGNHSLAKGRKRPVGQVRRKGRVVLRDRGAQQRHWFSRDGELEAGQQTSVVGEQPILALLNVAEGVCEQEGIAVLQGESRQQAPTRAGGFRGRHETNRTCSRCERSNFS